MFTAVFLDMDDVIVDLARGFREATGLPLSHELEDEIGFHAYWAKVDIQRPGFWRNLQYKSGGPHLLATVHSLFDLKDIHILSAIFKEHEECETEKRGWVEERTKILPDNVNIVPRRDKKKFAHSKHSGSHLLIDDREENCQEWEAAGGTALRYNQDPDYNINVLRVMCRNRGVFRRQSGKI